MERQSVRFAAVTATLLTVSGLLFLKARGDAQSLPSGAASAVSAGTSLAVIPITPTRIRDQFVYSVPILCGAALTPYGSVTAASLTGSARLASGTYLTTIRVHNPDDQAAVTFTERAIEANPRELSRGLVSPTFRETLQADQALEVNCTDLIRLLGKTPASAFVVLRSPAPLDVMAIHAAAGPIP
jgi:hypothetical protein